MALPPWAYSNTKLPPWYGPGGARNTPSSPVARPPVFNPTAYTETGGGYKRPMGRAEGNGRPLPAKPMIPQATTPPVQAPRNPWTTPAPPQIYPDSTQVEDSIIQRLLNGLNTARGQNTADVNRRLENADIPTPEIFTPREQNYQRSDDFTDTLNRVKTFADTGGYSGEDLSNLRARGISPIRAVYANAMRGLDRQRALQGGYAPGMAAAISRMAREMSEQVAGATTNVNADIAEKVQRGKLAGLEHLTGLTSRENDMINQIVGRNVETGNEAGQFNIRNKMEADARRAAMRESIFGSASASDDRYNDDALRIAELQNQMLQASRGGRLNERNVTNTGNLNWEEFNQRGGLALMEALMQQYGPRS